MRDTKEILTAWKNTRVAKRMGMEFPAQSACMIGAPRGFDFRQYLTEEEAEVVDKAVLLLMVDNIELHTVLTLFYLDGISCSRQAKILGKRTDDMTKLLSIAEGFVRGCIINFFKKAA